MPFALTMYNRREVGAGMVQETRLITAEELFRMPDDGFHKYELVRGRLLTMTPPGGVHGAIALRLGAVIAAHVDQHKLGVVSVESGFKLETNPDTVRGPDVSFVVRSRIPDGGIPNAFWPGAPDLAVEVRSPDDNLSEVAEKIAQYLATGVRQVWFVDPSTRTVTIHRPHAVPLILSQASTLTAGDLLPGFQYPLARLFAFD
jgi:Uma2 family endonuclease